VFTPAPPARRVPPLEIARDTYLIRQVQEAIIGPLTVYMNSLVINGAEPIIVDTGTPVNREQWLKDVFAIVKPEAVRWIFLSHDDVDHSGNLHQVMEACPNATLVTSWFMIERHSCEFEFPLDRCRWVNEGQSWRAGDRTFTAVRPPLFDSPTTRGLFDDRTGVYWAVDSFATPVPELMDDIATLDDETWGMGISLFNRMNSPWFEWLDAAKFAAQVDRSQSLDIKVLAACHSPVIQGAKIGQAFGMIRGLPGQPAAPQPEQVDLEALMHAAATGQPYAWQPPMPVGA
jgi:flavorubredoxin